VAVKGIDGKRAVRLVDTYTLAKRVESSLKGKVAEKKILNVHKAPFIAEVWDKYAAWAVREKKDWRHDLGRWKWHVAPHVKDKRMDQLYPYEVESIIDKMKKIKPGFRKKDAENDVEFVDEKHAPATRKQVLVLIKRVYNWSIKREIYYGANPAAKIEAPKVNNQVTECLTRSELDRLLCVLDKWVNKRAALIVRFALLTGFRLDEVIGLEWRDVDVEKKFARLVDPKGNPVTLPICNKAVQILSDAKKNQPISNCPYVFPNKKGKRRVSFSKIWSRIRKKAEIPTGFRFHGLRHTFASYLASSGEVDLYTLQKLLNHQDPKMTQRYAHLLDEALRKGANVAGKVF
jgi:integrase